MTIQVSNSTLSLAQPLTHGGVPFESIAEIVRPVLFVPTFVFGTTAQIDELLSVPFMSGAGVYMFVRFPRSVLDPVRVRIGEGGSVAARLEGKRDEWVAAGFDLGIVVTCSHSRFDKEVAEALEARVTAKVEAERSAEVQRERAPKLRRLSPDVQRALDSVFCQLQMELEKRRIFLLSSTPSCAYAGVPAPDHGREQSHSREVREHLALQPDAPQQGRVLHLQYLDLEGTLVEMPDHVVIQRGTEVAKHEVAALQTASRMARRDLIRSGVIGVHPTHPDRMVFTTDHRVGSLTTASRLCTGSTQSGTHVWRPRHRKSI